MALPAAGIPGMLETDHAGMKRLARTLMQAPLLPPYDEYRGYILESLGQLVMRIPGTYGYKLNLTAISGFSEVIAIDNPAVAGAALEMKAIGLRLAKISKPSFES